MGEPVVELLILAARPGSLPPTVLLDMQLVVRWRRLRYIVADDVVVDFGE